MRYPRPQAETRSPRYATAKHGFTLIELLAVLVIISVVATFAMLSLGVRDPDTVVRREAERLTALIVLASEEAILRSREMALRVRERGYDFLVLSGEKWQLIEDDELFRQRQLPADITMELSIEGDLQPAGGGDDVSYPMIFLISSGEMTPFEMELRADDGARPFHIRGDLSGRVVLEDPARRKAIPES